MGVCGHEGRLAVDITGWHACNFIQGGHGKGMRQAKYVKSVTSEAKFAIESRRRRADCRQLEHRAALLRSSLYDELYKMLRPLKVRRKISAERAVLNKASRIGMCNLTDEEQRRHPINNLSVDQWELEGNGEI